MDLKYAGVNLGSCMMYDLSQVFNNKAVPSDSAG
jgi:hypothetical protein